jgi:DNA-binding beta-propeller fold protein YncE
MDGLIFQLDADGKMIGYHGNPGRDNPNAPAAGRSDLIGESHYLAVTPDQKTIYIADSINGKVLRLERN